jgi:hypothetical protein
MGEDCPNLYVALSPPSISDVGLNPTPVTVMRPPYGETFFGHPTDGRVILDIVGKHPLLAYYLLALVSGDDHRSTRSHR